MTIGRPAGNGSSRYALRGAWAPELDIAAPTPRVQGPDDHVRPAFAVQPWPSQHSRGVVVRPATDALRDFTRQDARALGVRDVIPVSADTAAAIATGAAAFPGDTVADPSAPAGCMPLPPL